MDTILARHQVLTKNQTQENQNTLEILMPEHLDPEARTKMLMTPVIKWKTHVIVWTWKPILLPTRPKTKIKCWKIFKLRWKPLPT